MSRREKIEKLLEKEPDDVFLNFGLAMELVKENEPEDALARFDRVLQLDPRYHAAHFHKGSTLIALGRADEARRVLTQGVAAARASGNAHAEGEMTELLASVA
jgi:predicted Zn-dependent protease